MTNSETFRRIASLLSNAKFTTELTEGELRAANIVRSMERGIRIYKLKGFRWAVNYYAAGEARTWARPIDHVVACRLADMLTWRNADKRIRLAKGKLTLEDFNISPERAKMDIANEGEIISLIIQMEVCLPEKTPRAGRPKNVKNKTLRDEVLHIFDTIMFRLNDVLAAQGTADKKLGELRHILHLVQTQTGMLPAPTPVVIPAEQPYSPTPGPGWPLPPGPTCVPGSTGNPLPPMPSVFCATNLAVDSKGESHPRLTTSDFNEEQG